MVKERNIASFTEILDELPILKNSTYMDTFVNTPKEEYSHIFNWCSVPLFAYSEKVLLPGGCVYTDILFFASSMKHFNGMDVAVDVSGKLEIYKNYYGRSDDSRVLSALYPLEIPEVKDYIYGLFWR